MTKSKHTKKALLMSVLSMFVCMAMLVGSTFAWFTDSVTSGKNKIVAGNLDIELNYQNASMTSFAEVKANTTDLFVTPEGAEILWEPGAVAVSYLELKNAGSLALKYKLSVDAKDTVVGEDGAALSQVLKTAVVEIDKAEVGTYDRAAALEKVKAADAESILTYAKEDRMTAKDETVYLAMIVYFPEEVGNEQDGMVYNRKDVELKTELSLNVAATQTPFESDSFGENYDEKASTEQNMNAIKLSAQGYKMISALEDLTYTVTEDNGDKVAFISSTGKFVLNADLPQDIDWVFNSNDAPIVIDLNGHTVKNCFYVEDGADLTITDSYGNGKTGFELAVFEGSLTIDGGKHGNIGVLGGNLTINDGSCALVIGEGGAAGTNNYADGEVVVNGGTITSFYIWQWTNKVTINGGKFPAYGGFSRPLPYGNKDVIDIYGGLFQKVSLNDLPEYVRGDSVITEITDDQNKTWYKVTLP